MEEGRGENGPAKPRVDSKSAHKSQLKHAYARTWEHTVVGTHIPVPPLRTCEDRSATVRAAPQQTERLLQRLLPLPPPPPSHALRGRGGHDRRESHCRRQERATGAAGTGGRDCFLWDFLEGTAGTGGVEGVTHPRAPAPAPAPAPATGTAPSSLSKSKSLRGRDSPVPAPAPTPALDSAESAASRGDKGPGAALADAGAGGAPGMPCEPRRLVRLCTAPAGMGEGTVPRDAVAMKGVSLAGGTR